MKKIHLGMAAIILIAVMSAFTTAKPTTVYYRDLSGEFIEKTMAGNCQPYPPLACEYIWTGAVDNDPQNENNYEVVEGFEEQRFVPSQP
jgi:hypothetical protein